ncbi:MAG: hypothetical protein ACFFD2_00765 [Promethearchaeota archaeon]
MIQPNNSNLTPELFQKFLLNTILDEDFGYIFSKDSLREYVTAIERLIDESIIVQIQTDDLKLSDINIICLTPELIKKLLKILYLMRYKDGDRSK